MKNVSEKGIAHLHDEYVRDVIDADELDDELEFWLHVEACDLCDGQMCSGHYARWYGGW